MTPPVAPVADTGPQPAVSVCPAPRIRPLVLAQRADFLRAAQARRQGMPGFLLQARKRAGDETEAAGSLRVGFTCSKKVGNAVARNRAKRRLRAIAAEVLPVQGRPGWDYVLVGRPGETAARPFAEMLSDLVRALDRVHDDNARNAPPRPDGSRKGKRR